jgi:putative ABC transport system permease protein
MLGTVWHDARYAVRTFLKSPGFTAVALLALALGIGANTAIFSVVNAVLLRSLPYRDADRLAVVWETNRQRGYRRNVMSPANFVELRTQAQSFEGLSAFYDWRFNLTGAGEPVEVPVQVTTADLFDVLGARAALGRTYTVEEVRAGREDLAVLSHGFWLSRFGGAHDVVGKTVALNGEPVEIVGVMPPEFRWFVKENSRGGKPASMWVPTRLNPQGRGRYLSAVGRLKPGVSPEQASAELDTIAARLEQQSPQFNAAQGLALVPVREQLAGELRTPLMILLGAVGFVLLIACANVANLLLARAAVRSKEIAVRAALGAARSRIIRQLLTESLLLALAGGLLGLLLAAWGVDALVALSPPNLIGEGEVRVSLPVLGFTFGVALLTGVVFGLMPALEASRFDANEALKESGRGTTGGPRGRRLRGAFVVAQVALALVLLVGAGLLIRSFARLQSVDPGFDPENLLTMRVDLPATKYKEDAQIVSFYRQATERLAALPGVRSATAINYLPFYSGLGARTGFVIEGRPAPRPGEEPSTDVRVTDENYFRTLNIPVIRGRTFTPQEAAEKRPVVVISETLARRHFPGEDPVGKRIAVEMEPNPPMCEIIGVVGDVRYDKLDGELYPMVYETPAQLTYPAMTFVVRTQGDPLALAAAARREVQAIDSDLPLADVRTLRSWMGESVARTRFGTLLLTVFAAVALLLAAVGIYGVMSYSVAQRTHEIGIRMAMGAQRRDVVRLVVGQGLLLTAVGVALGAAGAFGLTRLMTGLLYGVTATDPATFGVVALVLSAAALLACYLPARRAAKVDPMVALRYE